ncbi:hypothetical protein, partial [Xanthomonas fragariae]|uniref:hypothetical protein n=1 Tax=Xanthomonas fragariae TaxID=48664 RepID=UPI003CCEBB4E
DPGDGMGILERRSPIIAGDWCLVLLVLGAWCLVLGAWCLVLGAWCLVLGAWCLKGVFQGRLVIAMVV